MIRRASGWHRPTPVADFRRDVLDMFKDVEGQEQVKGGKIQFFERGVMGEVELTGSELDVG